MKKRFLMIIALAMLLILGLSGCGRKPKVIVLVAGAPDEVVTDGSVVDYVASVDDLYSALQTYSTKANEIGTWVDNLVTQQGIVPSDLDKPMVSGITYPMFRSQTQEDFNTSATTFTDTVIDNINSMYQSIWFNWIRSYSADNYGSITDTNITAQIDCGYITDINITI